jgi:hypothetical protein
MGLAAEMIYGPHQNGKNDAQQDAGHDWEIETRIRTFVRNVAGEPA